MPLKGGGLGKIRHLAVADLWLQDKVRSGDISVYKVNGKDNPADVLTKWADRATLVKTLERMMVTSETGRAASAAKVDH